MDKIFDLFKNVEVLVMPKSIADKDLESITKLTKLKSLDLQNNRKLTDAGFANLANLLDLQFLNLRDTSISNESLIHVTNLKFLISLNLSCCRQIYYAGFAHLSNILTLQSLDLSDTTMSMTGRFF